MSGIISLESKIVQAITPITAESILIADDALTIALPDHTVRIPWHECSDKLANATAEQRRDAELSPGGYGIHWPQLDEDLSVSGLVLANDSNVKP